MDLYVRWSETQEDDETRHSKRYGATSTTIAKATARRSQREEANHLMHATIRGFWLCMLNTPRLGGHGRDAV